MLQRTRQKLSQQPQHSMHRSRFPCTQLKSVSQDMQAEVKELQKQLSQSSMSVEPDVKKKQLTEV